MIEAMACGTPVIAFRRGSVPEVLEEHHGLLVEDVGEAVAAIDAVGRLDRGRIRATFERRFTAEVMARNYLRLYRLGHQPVPPFILVPPAQDRATLVSG